MNEVQKKIRKLEIELRELRKQLFSEADSPQTVIVPDQIEPIFLEIEKKESGYFHDLQFDPFSGEITVDGERYVLFRSASISYEFIEFIKERYSDRPTNEAISIGNNFLYDNAKVIGKKDAIAFHNKLNLKDPIEKLSAGPVHFAFTGWANVEIFPESNPTADENYFLKFQHHNSFEAKSWIKTGKQSKTPVCTMNCGYSAGWCEESFGLSLTTVELTCEAQGADACTFIMAPTDLIQKYVEREVDMGSLEDFEIPVFFKRKFIEEQLKQSVEQKELLIKEIHHRVKNNLQIIVSLLRLQMNKIDDAKFKDEFETSMNRVSTMAAVHELMYRGKNLDRLSLKTYFLNLTNSLLQLYSMDDKVEFEINLDVEDVDFSLEQSIPLGLILNEITCNSFKHAFKKGGKFFLYLKEDDGYYELTIGDTGPGLKKEDEDAGLGLSLIEILCEQIDAELEVQNSVKGLIYKIKFKVL